MRWVLFLAASATWVGGCYSPSAKVGAPCSSTGECPSGQHCDTTLEPPTCALADARPVDAPPDAPPTCATNTDCDPATPICELTTSYCRGCVADAECGTSDVCTEYDGTCHNASNALFVGPAGAGTQCTQGSPCTLGTAIAQAANNQRIIVILDGLYGSQFSIPNTYSANTLTLSGTDLDPAGAVVTPSSAQALFVAVNAKPLVVEGITFKGAPSSGVDNRGTLLLSHVLLEGNGTHGITSTSTFTTEIRDSVITTNSANGIEISAGTLVLERCQIIGNANGGLDLRTTGYTVENTVFHGNGTVVSNFGGARIQNVDGMSPQIFAFNTFRANAASVAANGLMCPATLTPDSSIFVDVVEGCTPAFSLTGVDPLFVSATDHHLQPSSPAIDMANPAATLTVDIDGQRRPQGAARDIGADEVPAQ